MYAMIHSLHPKLTGYRIAYAVPRDLRGSLVGANASEIPVGTSHMHQRVAVFSLATLGGAANEIRYLLYFWAP